MAVRTLLGRQKQVVVRLSALLDIYLDFRVLLGDPVEDALELRPVTADEEREQLPRLAQQALDDGVGDVVEIGAA